MIIFAKIRLSIDYKVFILLNVHPAEKYLGRIKAGGDSFDNIFIEEGWGLPRNRWNLWRFVVAMAPGDIVVVPQPYTFSVYRIADNVVYSNESIDKSLLVDWNGDHVDLGENGDLFNKEGKVVDLGFYRRVILIEKDISRSEYADQELYSRMKIRQTNAQINNIKQSVDNAIENFRNRKPLNLKASIQETAATIVLEKIRTIQNDNKFEELVQWYLESIGGKVLTPPKNESPTDAGDADKVAIFDRIGVAIMVQAKKHSGQTNSWAIEQISAYKKNHSFDDFTTILWVISSCDSFSKEAELLARSCGVKLIDGIRFSEMILDAGLEGMHL